MPKGATVTYKITVVNIERENRLMAWVGVTAIMGSMVALVKFALNRSRKTKVSHPVVATVSIYLLYTHVLALINMQMYTIMQVKGVNKQSEKKK